MNYSFISDLNHNINSETTKKKPKDPQEPTGLYQFVYRCISLILSHINSRVSKRDAESTLNHLQQSISIFTFHFSAFSAFLLHLNLFQFNLKFAFQIQSLIFQCKAVQSNIHYTLTRKYYNCKLKN